MLDDEITPLVHIALCDRDDCAWKHRGVTALGTTEAAQAHSRSAGHSVSLYEDHEKVGGTMPPAEGAGSRHVPEPAPEVIMDSNGAYWRRYPEHLSMCPVSTDNEPLATPIAVYQFVGWECAESPERLIEAANALLEALENDDDPSGPAECLRDLIGRDG